MSHDWCDNADCEIDHSALARLESYYEDIAVEASRGMDPI